MTSTPRLLLATLVALTLHPLVTAADLAQWRPLPAEWRTVEQAEGRAVLQGQTWSFLTSPDEYEHVRVQAAVTIAAPAREFDFFGSGWSAWPPRDWGDRGYEAAVLLRAGDESGYRVQLSHKYQDVALVKYPDGGYLRVAPCTVKLDHAHTITTSVRNDEVVVAVDGVEKIRARDTFLPLASGRVGVGVSSGAKVIFSDVEIEKLSVDARELPAPTHRPKFSARPWLGGRTWVFDGDEPILELHSVDDPSCFAKLRPDYKPQLTFDSHWGIENQGAFAEGKSRWTAPEIEGGGKSLRVRWSARSLNDRFTTRSTMAVGYDASRGTYTYDIDSQLEVLEGEPFHFRYGFDFEHHTPLDPFRWQYLVARRKTGELYHRPVYPIDPGPQHDLAMTSGQRVWFGRHLEKVHVAPAVEYACSPGDIEPRRCHTAVCAAFYDTGVAFEPQTAEAGTTLRVKYRYTGYSAEEAERLFRESKIYESPMLDPQHHYIFADEWPKLTFGQFVPLSQSWIYGRTPFLTAHNLRPSYELVQNCGAGSGFAMKLGPASFGKANLPAPAPLGPSRYVITAIVRGQNIHGPGGRIEIEANDSKAGKPLARAVHYVGSGSFDWMRQGFALDVPEGAGTLAVAFGNAGTGAMLVSDVEFRRLKDDESLPEGVLASAEGDARRLRSRARRCSR